LGGRSNFNEALLVGRGNANGEPQREYVGLGVGVLARI